MKKTTMKSISILLAVMLLLGAFSAAACNKNGDAHQTLSSSGDESTEETKESDETEESEETEETKTVPEESSGFDQEVEPTIVEALEQKYGAKIDERWMLMDGTAYVDWYVIEKSVNLEDGSQISDFVMDVPVIGVNGDETILQDVTKDVLRMVDIGLSNYCLDPSKFDPEFPTVTSFYIKRRGGSYLGECAPTFHKDGDIISLTLEVDAYGGGAHGSQEVVSYNADVSRENPLLKFSDIITNEGGLSRLAELCSAHVTEWGSYEAGMGFEENVIKNFPKTLNEEPIFSWAIVDTGIRFVFPEYSIGSYADGAAVLHVLNSELERIIKPEFLPDN